MDLSDFISFSVFFISAILCLTFSTLLHIFINYSPKVLVIVSKLDYIGRLLKAKFVFMKQDAFIALG
jgi:predicted membrane channel-forming protein YqfA (hemolysin III family)